MAISPLTLAALATSAVPDLDVSSYRLLNPDHQHEVSVVLETTVGTVLVQLPLTSVSEVHHSAKIMGQAALTEGVRSELPFEVPQVIGITRSGDTRAIVSTFLEGDRIDGEELSPDAHLCASIARATAAIHSLPMSIIHAQGLPTRSAQEVRAGASRIISRAYATGLLPEVVHRYWLATLSDQALWDFYPTVIHGTLSDDTVLVRDDAVCAILDWAECSVGDPAVDLAWLVASQPGTLRAVLEDYADAAPANTPALVERRAQFWHEFGLARWLLHGVEQQDQSLIDDAVELLDLLVPRASQSLTLPDGAEPPLTADHVLDQVPEGVTSMAETDRFDSLDDERMFTTEHDFGDEIAEVDPDATRPIAGTPSDPARAPEDGQQH